MAKEEKFLLVSLNASESKKLAQIISNDTSRKILNYLAEHKKATESELAKKLNIPISTVHYNLKHLVKAKLIDSKEYHYSEKGKEVNHYSLAKKYIIIAPSNAGIKTKLRTILPMALLVAGAAAIIHLFSKTFNAGFSAVKSENIVYNQAAAQASSGLPISVWFLIGGITAILIYILIILIMRWKK